MLFLNQVSFGRTKGATSFFHNEAVKCHKSYHNVVAYLSNFSINNNFSHFLHGLVRLFLCSLRYAGLFGTMCKEVREAIGVHFMA